MQGKVDRLDLTEGNIWVAGSTQQFPTQFWSKEMKRRSDTKGTSDTARSVESGDFVFANMRDKREALEHGADFEEVPETHGEENRNWREHWRVVAPRPACTRLGVTTQAGQERLVSVGHSAIFEGSVQIFDINAKGIPPVIDLCGTSMSDIKMQCDTGMKQVVMKMEYESDDEGEDYTLECVENVENGLISIKKAGDDNKDEIVEKVEAMTVRFKEIVASAVSENACVISYKGSQYLTVFQSGKVRRLVRVLVTERK